MPVRPAHRPCLWPRPFPRPRPNNNGSKPAGRVPYRGRVEIACDESGAEGEKLANGETRLFTHAAVAVSTPDALACLTELRARIGSPAQQYKANHLLRPRHRRVLEWFLSPDGPVSGRARVVLVDKERFLLQTFLGLLADPDAPGWLAVPDPAAAPVANALADHVRATHGAAAWRGVLDAVNELVRGRLDDDDFVPRCSFVPWPADRAALRAVRARQARNSRTRVDVDPLFWAITRVPVRWDRPVAVVHDRHLSLTPARVAALLAACPGLVRFELTPARLDARVQLADFMAGIVRRAHTAELTGAGDPALLGLVRPYLITPARSA